MITNEPWTSGEMLADSAGSGVKFVVPLETVPEAVASRVLPSKREMTRTPGIAVELEWLISRVVSPKPVQLTLISTGKDVKVTKSKTSMVAFTVTESSFLTWIAPSATRGSLFPARQQRRVRAPVSLEDGDVDTR